MARARSVLDARLLRVLRISTLHPHHDRVDCRPHLSVIVAAAMNGFAPPGGMPFPPPGGMPAPAPAWKSAKAADGKIYYFNSITNVTQWTKPEELFTPEERGTVGTDWQILEHEGKPYWAHKETKETTWTPPAEVKQNMERMAKLAPPIPPPP